MKIDAKFTLKENGWWNGLSRRGIPVKVRSTPEVDAAIAKDPVQCCRVMPELYDRYLAHKQTVEALLCSPWND